MNRIVFNEIIEFARSIVPYSRDPYELGRELGVDIILSKPMHKDGYLVCENGCKLIFVSSSVHNAHRRKFIIAHEIGHFLLHRNHLFCCANISEMGSSRINSSRQEQEANDFASEYLLPALQLTQFLPKDVLHFSIISKIADYFDVSMTFAAIKAVQLSNTESEILLCYEGNNLKWFSSCDYSLHRENIPVKCPINLLTTQTIADISGAWDTLYEGSVHQEIFRPVPTQSLILLSGNRYDKEDYDEF